MQPDFDAVVLGAGIAGASTAAFLARAGLRVAVLEREATAAPRSSSRSAGCFEPAQPADPLSQLARAADPLLVERGALRVRMGQLFVARGREASEALAAQVARHRAEGVEVREVPASEALERMPLLASANCEAALARAAFYPGGGLLDGYAIVSDLLADVRRAGGSVRFRSEARALRVEAGWIRGVATNEGEVTCRSVVDASGGWAGRLGAPHASPVRLAPLRRHLAILDGDPPPTVAPITHLVDDTCYARPEERGLLASPCDEIASDPASDAVEAEALELLARKLARLLPRAGDLGVRKAWSCHRTFAPDRLPVLGPDPRVGGLHHCSGLGGSGLTVGLECGRLVAAALAGDVNIPPSLAAARFAPGREISGRA